MNTLNPTRFSLMRLPLLALLLALPFALAACGGDADPVDADAGVMQAAPPTDDGMTDDEMHEMPDGTMMSDDEMDHDDMEMDGEAVRARMENGVQVARIEAGRMGYAPKQVSLEAGVPARLVFTRTVESDCSSQVKIPAFDVPVTDLPLNEPVAVEFTPTESGAFTFVCGMDMQRGSIMVRS
jgi:hypothetical protein